MSGCPVPDWSAGKQDPNQALADAVKAEFPQLSDECLREMIQNGELG